MNKIIGLLVLAFIFPEQLHTLFFPLIYHPKKKGMQLLRKWTDVIPVFMTVKRFLL